MNRISLLILTACCFQISIKSLAQESSASQIAAVIDKEYQEGIKSAKVIGLAVAVVDNNEVAYMNGFGFSDLANQVEVNPNTVFSIGSCTKTFTALAIMSLHEKGLLDINESIKKYIPELTIENRFDDGNEIYIKDILSHLAGLPSDILNGMAADEGPDMTWTIDELNKQKTISSNRFVFAYSNVGYNLLGELIERVSGMTYAEYLKTSIFEPLNMTNTNAGFNESMSKGYDKKKEVKNIGRNVEASGSINSSAADMTNFLKMMMGEGSFNGEQIFKKETITLMQNDYTKGITLESSDAYGFGVDVYSIRIGKEDDSRLVEGYGHNGYSPPFHADYRYIPELNVGVVVMSNTLKSGSMRSAGVILGSYLKEAKGLSYKLMGKESYIPSNCTESDIVGKYNLGVSMIEVKDIEKVKFKVDGVNVVMTRKGDSFDYSLKAKLLGFIPMKIKDVIFRFVKRGENVYFTQLDLDRKTEQYVAAKVDQILIPSSWKRICGNYEIVETYASSIEEFDFSKAEVKIKEQDGTVMLSIKTPGGKMEYMLDVVSDKLAFSGGVGRHMGYSAEILENGNVYFSGFEFRKRG
ncbi:MAG: serine hydrolase domain-containing protein [Ekhidna sp.]